MPSALSLSLSCLGTSFVINSNVLCSVPGFFFIEPSIQVELDRERERERVQERM